MILTFEEKELLKTMCDLYARTNGIQQIRSIIVVLDRIKQEDVIFNNADEIKFIEQLCDVTVRSTGLASLDAVVKVLNRIVTNAQKPVSIDKI